jgi:hypothetical protein
LDRLQIVEAANEKQVGYLLDDLERIRDASRPEGVPDLINLVADFSREHVSPDS